MRFFFMKKKEIFPFIVTSNVFLLFPIIAAYYRHQWIYFSIAVAMFVASAGFHYELNLDKKNPMTKKFQILDWLFAGLGTMYVFYFINQSPADFSLKALFAILFMLTLGFFWYSFILKDYKDYTRLHPWFHVLVQTLLGFIVLFL